MTTKGTTKNNGQKDLFDRFYTQPHEAFDLVGSLANFMQKNGLDPQQTEFYEPSAGDGAFVVAIEKVFPNSIINAFDIEPAREQLCTTKIVKQDFLKTKISYSENRIVIGNPPFGEQGKLCFSFIKKALEIAPIVCFILPPSFRKESYQQRLGLSPVKIIDISDTSYRIDGKKIVVPSAFFVFTHDSIFVKKKIDYDILPFSFLPKSETARADFTIRRIGGNAGKATSNTNVSQQSNYFCCAKHGNVHSIISMINAISFPERDWSVGPRSLSKREIAWRVIETMHDNDA